MDAGLLTTTRTVTPSRRYHPPRSWQFVTVRELAEGSSRISITPDQLQLLASDRKANGKEVGVYVSGDVSLVQRRCVSIIGTRKCSGEGAARARRLARELVAHEVVIVSGLAEGIDTNAMTATIASGGRTIGVIGTPLDKAYPARNGELQEEVYRDHLLISQFGSGERVFRSNFPQRNRLMAVLSDATVVIEASDTSGTLHQAAECVRLGRWLFIAKSVVDDTSLAWPKKFLNYERTRVLSHPDDVISSVYR